MSPTPDASVTGSIVKQESQASDGVLADLDEMSQRSWRSDSPEKVSSAGRSAAQEVAIGKPRERQTIVTAPSSVMPRRVRLELVRFSFMSVGRIDCVEQSFRAQIFFELRIPGAAHDPDLSAEGDTFPQPPPGQLPRPPARWFVSQLDHPPRALLNFKQRMIVALCAQQSIVALCTCRVPLSAQPHTSSRFMNQIDIKNFMVHAQPLNSHCFKRGDDIHLSLRCAHICICMHMGMGMGMGMDMHATLPYLTSPYLTLPYLTLPQMRVTLWRIWSSSIFPSTCKS